MPGAAFVRSASNRPECPRAPSAAWSARMPANRSLAIALDTPRVDVRIWPMSGPPECRIEVDRVLGQSSL
jgi:hypothetical protein